MRCAARPSPNGNICRSELGRREQQVGVGVDHGAIFLLRPGQQRIMRPQARLDMRDRDPGDEGSQRAAKRARRVALNDDEVRRPRRSGRRARVTAWKWTCGFSSPGQFNSIRGKAFSPNSSGVSAACCPVKISVGIKPCAARALATGLSLMASGLVPMTSLMSAERSLPPSSAGTTCLD